MDVSAVPPVNIGQTAALAQTSEGSVTPPAVGGNNAPTNVVPNDVVTLSVQAQQILSATTQTDETSTAASETVSANVPTPFTKNADQFALAAIITDTSGKYTLSDQLQAYLAFQAQGPATNFLGSPDTQEVASQVNNSPIAQLSTQLQYQYTAALIAGQQSGGYTGAARESQAAFDSMSSFNQQVLFDTAINQQLPNQDQVYSSIDQFRAVNQARIQLGGYLDSGKSYAGNDISGVIAADPMLAAAQKITDSTRFDAAAFISQVAMLFGNPNGTPSSSSVPPTSQASDEVAAIVPVVAIQQAAGVKDSL